MRAWITAALVLLSTQAALAQNSLTITEVKVDRPTLHTAGIQVLIAGDANRNASIAVRVGSTEALPLFRVRPETVTGRTVPEQLAGTIFDLAPGSTYTVDLIATDPDGGSTTRQVIVTTRALPRDPVTPKIRPVTTAAELSSALQTAQPGDVITLADGVYAGPFTVSVSGTATQPIVIRGTSQVGTILDGNNCAACNIVEAAVSHVHLERMTIRNGVRGIRFLGTGTTANAVSHVTVENVVHGIGSGVDQTDFTICDNVIAGRLAWPLIYTDDGAIHADDQGIRVDGSGHVVCHNEISGFGDPMINFAEGGRAYDFYGNDIHEIYGDGTELDRGEGNVRLFANRFTNVYTAISIQPAYGGPVYVLRNQVVNVVDEQIKLKSVGGTVEPSGVLIYHNTFVSPRSALNLQTPVTQHNFVIANNLFFGPDTPVGRSVEWTAAIDGGEFDYNAYYPDTGYWLGTVGTARTFATLAAAPAGVEDHGVVLAHPTFTPAYSPLSNYMIQVMPPQLVLDPTSPAVDVGRALPGINARHIGAGADIGATERGCPSPHYGPRPAGSESVTTKVDCAADDVDPGGDGPPGGNDLTGTDPDGDGGCCQSSQRPRGGLLLIALVVLALRRRRD